MYIHLLDCPIDIQAQRAVEHRASHVHVHEADLNSELPAGDGVKGEASASSLPSLGVSSLDCQPSAQADGLALSGAVPEPKEPLIRDGHHWRNFRDAYGWPETEIQERWQDFVGGPAGAPGYVPGSRFSAPAPSASHSEPSA